MDSMELKGRDHSVNANDLPACDLVLKGGITSGAVYPGAIVKLSATYRFHQLGGTSAGAIAAAAAAAAELGHQTKRVPDAFERLATLPERLGAPIAPGSRKNVLLALFRPTERADRIFGTVIAAAGGGNAAMPKVIMGALRHYPIAALLGIAPAIVAVLVSPLATELTGRVVQFLFLSGVILVGAVLALVVALFRDAARVLPDQGWGLCAGVRDDGGKEDPHSLSNWLHSYFNELAGLGEDEVLTFGHLWQASTSPVDEKTPPGDRKIVLKVMTTSLSTQRPFSIPFETSDASDLYFDPNDLKGVLPARILSHLVAHSTVSDNFAPYRNLPAANQFPVAMAVRMSLSFPFLLSAVKLQSPDYSRVRVSESMQPMWFSDGGICSNLPVQVFDAPIPSHPTFTINLLEPHPDVNADASTEVNPVARAKIEKQIARIRRMAFANDNNASGSQGYRSYFHETNGAASLVAFTMAVVDSARNWVDASQMRLQGYRERVGNVVVNPDEGGLNLSMSKAMIAALSDRGSAVAEDLQRVFSQPIWTGHATGMQRHLWLRVRNQLGALATYFSKVRLSIAGGKLTVADLKAMVELHPGTNTDEDKLASQKDALKGLIDALDTASASPAVAQVIDKSDADLTLRPRY